MTNAKSCLFSCRHERIRFFRETTRSIHEKTRFSRTRRIERGERMFRFGSRVLRITRVSSIVGLLASSLPRVIPGWQRYKERKYAQRHMNDEDTSQFFDTKTVRFGVCWIVAFRNCRSGSTRLQAKKNCKCAHPTSAKIIHFVVPSYVCCHSCQVILPHLVNKSICPHFGQVIVEYIINKR